MIEGAMARRSQAARRRSRSRARRSVKIAVAAILAETILMRLRGYRVGRDVIVRCREGHLFTTIWIPGVSLKSARLGLWRFQRCPVGKHWSIVTLVRKADLSEEERRDAAEHKDIPIP